MSLAHVAYGKCPASAAPVEKSYLTGGFSLCATPFGCGIASAAYMPLRGRDSQKPSLTRRAYAVSTVAVLMCR